MGTLARPCKLFQNDFKDLSSSSLSFVPVLGVDEELRRSWGRYVVYGVGQGLHPGVVSDLEVCGGRRGPPRCATLSDESLSSFRAKGGGSNPRKEI